jgi:hypothetical protein
MWDIGKLIESQRPELAPVNTDLLFEAFQIYGYRPQFFMKGLTRVVGPFYEEKGRFEELLCQEAEKQHDEDKGQMESDFLGLKPIEQVVLWRIFEAKSDFRPYDTDSQKFYKEKLGESLNSAKIQNALEALRTQTPSLVWKSARGAYALSDSNMYNWYDEKVRSGLWPPPRSCECQE